MTEKINQKNVGGYLQIL